MRGAQPLCAPWNGASYGLYRTGDNQYMVIAIGYSEEEISKLKEEHVIDTSL